MAQLYKKPPITESVVAVTVKPPLGEDVLDKIHKRLLEDYPAPVQRVTTTEVEFAVGGEAKVKHSTPGYRLTAADGASVVNLMPGQIITSRLAPYEGWDSFAARGQQNWDVWKRLAGWRAIVRIGVRYVNRIDIPDEGKPIQLEQYLRVSPRMPQFMGLPPMNHFAVNAQAPLGKDNCKLVLNVGTIPSPLIKTASFLLDIDIVVDTNPPQNDEDLWALIDRIRGYKNAIFEASITDKTRMLFFVMSSLLLTQRSRSILEAPVGAILPSFGAGADAKAIENRLAAIREIQTGAISQIAAVRDVNAKGLNLTEQLQLKLVSLKRLASTVAMYLDREWRSKLFARLDVMLDPEGWDAESLLPSEQSFSTFLRMIIYLHPTRRPGVGLSPSGHFAAAWTRGNDRIVIECIGNDEVRWVISCEVDGERESCAGKVSLHRIPDVTAPYNPEPLFTNGQRILA